MAKKWHKIIFFLVLAISSLLRLGGIYPSFPPYHSDEGMSYAQGISIIKENTLDAHGYTLSLGYPFLIPYINAFFFKFFFIPLSWSIFLFKKIFNIIDGIIKFTIDERD